MISEKEKEHIGIARELLDNPGESCPLYVSFDDDYYILNKKQIYMIAKALYLADIELNPNNEDEKY